MSLKQIGKEFRVRDFDSSRKGGRSGLLSHSSFSV